MNESRHTIIFAVCGYQGVISLIRVSRVTYEWITSPHQHPRYSQCVGIKESNHSYKLIERTPPPRGVFPIYYVPWSRDQFWGWFFRGGPLPPGSWSGNIVNWKTPRGGPGGGVSFDQSESCDIRINHVTSSTSAIFWYEKFTSTIQTSRVKYEWITSPHQYLQCPQCSGVNISFRENECLILCIWMSHVTYLNGWFHIYERATLYHQCPQYCGVNASFRIRMTHAQISRTQVAYLDESDYIWMRHAVSEARCVINVHNVAVWMPHFAHTNATLHKYEWAMSHIWMSHITYEWVTLGHQVLQWFFMNASFRAYECLIAQIWIGHVTIWMSLSTHLTE